ncbi:MAG TPA: UDP-N-acetylmuramoyl-tripeptide--D-alanyl-D-alanine ligase [Rhodoferax sp.]|nr:UDP-N-acetylmuramoyl-tripeptide--D-alanyl-D-alanine ligase [Rhodoferax sp.]HOF50945.1 UDP-N-acetylmuramoyl-tripeptide--D-alanyl-D-alanine ligase [Rhodoferax sp.]
MMTLHQATQWMPGARLVGENKVVVLRVHTDTRTVEPGDLFVALQGERYDANEFLQEAQQRGAVGVVCHAGLRADLYPAGLPRIEVADTKAALQSLATTWRARFTLPVIAVTGSNGKTTVTQMLAAILDAQCPGGGALATRGNFNNDIGVPLTLLRLRAGHRMAVVELGMNHPGEIATLAAMAQPTVALVNNAQREHLEFMQTVQAVARENGSVIASLPADGVAVVPADDEFTALWQDLAAPRRCVRFALSGGDSQDEMHCVETHWEHGGWQVRAQGMGAHLHYRLSIAGRHNVKNSLAAAACALAAGVSASAVEQGLQAFQPVKGRSRALEIAVQGRERTLVDDTYNANPDSVRAAIDVLADLPGPRILVLGDMGEVGHEGPAFHAEAGRYALAKGIDQLLAHGNLVRSAVDVFPGARHFESMDELNDAVLAGLPHASSVLVKGSRFMRMERVVEAVVAHFSNGEP